MLEENKTTASWDEADYDDDDEEDKDDEDYAPSSDDEHKQIISSETRAKNIPKQRERKGNSDTLKRGRKRSITRKDSSGNISDHDGNTFRRSDEYQQVVASETGARKQENPKQKKTQASAQKKRKESFNTSKRRNNSPVGRQESTVNIGDADGIASGSRKEEKSIKRKRNELQEISICVPIGRSSTRKVKKTKRDKEKSLQSPKTITYGIRSKVRSATTNLAHPCATKRPWKWTACNECIACLKTKDCGKCGQCLADLPCILRQCITPIRADMNKPTAPEDDNESLSSMESNISDLEWEEVVPERHYGKISPKELWNNWFSIRKE